MESRYNEKHFYAKNCHIYLNSNDTEFCHQRLPVGIALDERMVEAAMAAEILSQEKIDILVEKRHLEPCIFDYRLGGCWREGKGYIFSKGAEGPYNKILEEASRRHDYSEPI